MARKRPCLDAEVRAFDLLERRDFLTKTDAMDVLRRIPSGEWARRHGGKMLMISGWPLACVALPGGTLSPRGY